MSAGVDKVVALPFQNVVGTAHQFSLNCGTVTAAFPILFLKPVNQTAGKLEGLKADSFRVREIRDVTSDRKSVV